MDEELHLVTDWLLCASSQIGPEYFQLPIAGAPPDEAEYRERVYCYELYHRWRCHWIDGFPYLLTGELDKQGHPLIRGGAKPDFLVHIPGEMNNLVIVEVKAADAAWERMGDDLKKLTRFRRDLSDQNHPSANYRGAYFWIYGIGITRWPVFRNRLMQEVGGSAEFDQSLISCILHEHPGSRAVLVPWE
jgi:hypothetical protein